MDGNDRIRPECDAHLQEHAEIIDLPFDRLRQCRDTDNVVLEMSETPRLHVPVAKPGVNALMLFAGYAETQHV
jgi:hypothetical protein